MRAPVDEVEVKVILQRGRVEHLERTPSDLPRRAARRRGGRAQRAVAADGAEGVRRVRAVAQAAGGAQRLETEQVSRRRGGVRVPTRRRDGGVRGARGGERGRRRRRRRAEARPGRRREARGVVVAEELSAEERGIRRGRVLALARRVRRARGRRGAVQEVESPKPRGRAPRRHEAVRVHRVRLRDAGGGVRELVRTAARRTARATRYVRHPRRGPAVANDAPPGKTTLPRGAIILSEASETFPSPPLTRGEDRSERRAALDERASFAGCATRPNPAPKSVRARTNARDPTDEAHACDIDGTRRPRGAASPASSRIGEKRRCLFSLSKRARVKPGAGSDDGHFHRDAPRFDPRRENV